ncbi:unnamed protein product [Rotaria magnacalcarata]|uniref:riboflavin kinase n=1 Tax=Rotaria magnacalcarata TaxID=392030 RepID=A0A816WGC0_9BILA|nr:unnamed protein product [Rotaria magnacalcarata]
MFANRPQSRRPYPPSSRSQVSPALNDVWRLIWPFTTTTILGICLILCVLVIGALETASLAISTDQIYYGNTSSTGAGFWCEFYVFIAATLILIINFVLHTRLWATMALLGTFTAAGFSIVIIGLDARAVRDANDRFGMLPKKIMAGSSFPYYTLGTIVHGLGRGGKELGCPTANFDENAVAKLPSSIYQGVYYGWAKVLIPDNNQVYKMVTSVGTNPFYNGEKKTMETHILHKFTNDFYGETVKIVLLGEIRKMTTFNNASELSNAIQNDISTANNKLDSEECRQYLNDPFFQP